MTELRKMQNITDPTISQSAKYVRLLMTEQVSTYKTFSKKM